MSFVRGLTSKESGTIYPVEPRTACDRDFSPVEVSYDYDAMKDRVTRSTIEGGPRSLWRYKDLLPIEGAPRAGLRSGLTPLIRADHLAAELGVRELYIKDDSANYPTLSYKDRVVSVALTKALEFGFDTMGCASTGNLAHSVAAHAAQAGVDAYLMVPHGLEEGKIVSARVFGPRLMEIEGNYDDVNRLCAQIADKYGWAIVNVNLRPFYTEGAKTHGFEIAEQMGWRLPDHTVLPVAGGTLLPKVWKGYRELLELGLVADNGPRIHAAQAAGCDPVVRAIQAGSDDFDPQKPDTIATSIAIGDPADGYYAIRIVRDSGGGGASATDPEILDAVKLLARTEGIFAEPAGGTTLAAAIKLIEQGRIRPDESVCVSVTGNGIKTASVMQGQFEEAPVIPAKLDAFDAAMGTRGGEPRGVAAPAP